MVRTTVLEVLPDVRHAFGISSPTRRWTELRRMGHVIKSRKVVELNRYGEPTPHYEYWLEE